jgi:hypothetical protein
MAVGAQHWRVNWRYRVIPHLVMAEDTFRDCPDSGRSGPVNVRMDEAPCRHTDPWPDTGVAGHAMTDRYSAGGRGHTQAAGGTARMIKGYPGAGLCWPDVAGCAGLRR